MKTSHERPESYSEYNEDEEKEEEHDQEENYSNNEFDDDEEKGSRDFHDGFGR